MDTIEGRINLPINRNCHNEAAPQYTRQRPELTKADAVYNEQSKSSTT
jgi:hypothetical protein